MRSAFSPRFAILFIASFAVLIVRPAVAMAAKGGEPSPLAASASRLTCAPNPLQFGRVGLTQSRTLLLTLENHGKTSIAVKRVRTSSAGLEVADPGFPVTLAPGKSRKVRVRFKPPAKGSFSGHLTVVSNASDPIFDLAVQGFGMTGSLISNPRSVSFGGVRVGSAKAEYATLKNSSSTSVTISAASVPASDFSLGGLSFPLTLRVGESYTFKAVFRPKSSGSKTGSITVVSNAADSTLKIAVSGEGTPAGQLSLGPTSLNFGEVNVGKSKNLASSLSASVASVTVSAVSLDSAEFLVSDLSLPLTLRPGQSTQFTVKFAPQMSGAASGKMSFHSNAADPSLSEVLTGSGSVASKHKVALSWSGSTRAAGYNVYRSQVSGRQFTRLNSVLDKDTTFTDSTVESGQTYYYMTTAVGGNGVESAPSNQVEAVIP